MKKGDQLCILRAEVKTDTDALNLLRLVGALTAIGVPLDDDCPYLETRELIEGRERRNDGFEFAQVLLVASGAFFDHGLFLPVFDEGFLDCVHDALRSVSKLTLARSRSGT